MEPSGRTQSSHVVTSFRKGAASLEPRCFGQGVLKLGSGIISSFDKKEGNIREKVQQRENESWESSYISLLSGGVPREIKETSGVGRKKTAYLSSKEGGPSLGRGSFRGRARELKNAVSIPWRSCSIAKVMTDKMVIGGKSPIGKKKHTPRNNSSLEGGEISDELPKKFNEIISSCWGGVFRERAKGKEERRDVLAFFRR